MSNRHPGYYRVKHFGKWTFAIWRKYKDNAAVGWSIIGTSICFMDSDFDKIDERRINEIPEQGEEDFNVSITK